MARRRQRDGQTLCRLDVLPFLSIMLGLMSVMALCTLGFAFEQRQEQRKIANVELVGVPESLVPLQIRLSAESVDWFEGGKWHRLDPTDLAYLQAQGLSAYSLPEQALKFADFLRGKVEDNRRLSFQGKQHTVLLWLEPDGFRNWIFVQAVIDDAELPVRLGQLPILPGETIVSPTVSGARRPAPDDTGDIIRRVENGED